MPRKRKAPGIDGIDRPSKRRTAVVEKRITRTMTTDGPRQAVFKTIELLEMILMKLPIRTVFGIQRVCRQFREIVATSTAVQQKLFLQPTGVERQVWATYREYPNPPVRPYAVDAHFVKARDDAEDKTTEKRVTPARFNPLLSLPAYRLNYSAADRAWIGRGEEVTFASWVTVLPENESASWRRMQLTDSPTTSAYVNLTLGTGKSWSSYGGLMWNAEDRRGQGLTLGDMMDAGNEAENVKDCHVSISGRLFGTSFGSTLESIAQTVSEASRQSVRVRADDSWIELKGMVIPSDPEWEEMSTTGRASVR